MAQSKEDIKHGAAQAKLSEDEMLRVRYKHDTPLEGGKIADSQPVDIFVAARRVSEAAHGEEHDVNLNSRAPPSDQESIKPAAAADQN